MSIRSFAVLLTLSLLATACELSRELTTPERAPTLSTVIPGEATLADTALVLRVSGHNFTSGTRIHWNATEIIPDVRTERELFFTVPAELYPVSGTYEIRIRHEGGPLPDLWRNFNVHEPASSFAPYHGTPSGEIDLERREVAP